MTSVSIYFLTIIGGYLIGSISFARLVVSRLKPGGIPTLIRTPTIDGEAELISHAIGATNVMIEFGPRWGIFVTFLDMMKAFIPTIILSLIYPEESYHLVVASAVLVGHLWPVWYHFSGGGGNACVLGMLLAISPIGLILTHFGGFLISLFAPMLSFVSGIALTIPWFVIRNGLFSPESFFAVIITVLYVLAELPEIKQLKQLNREGHQLNYKFVTSVMKRSTVTGQPGQRIKD